MIGSALKKLAKEHQMMVSHGVAYGALQGFAVTLSEGAGYKKFSFSTRIPEAEKRTALLNEVGQTDLRKQYRVEDLFFNDKSIIVVFHDDPGTMAKVRAFLEWFLPRLRDSGATGWNVCPECGSTVTGGRWVMIDGVAHYFHPACAETVKRGITESEQSQKEARTGSYLSGAMGALLGAALGAVVWAVVLLMGYMASLVGLLIGWLSEKGYDLLKGKQGKGKVAILIVAVVFGVLLGTVAADVFTLVGYINDGEMFGLTYGDIPAVLIMLFTEDAEYRSITLGNVAMGLLFAGLGVFAMLRKTSSQVSDTKIVELQKEL